MQNTQLHVSEQALLDLIRRRCKRDSQGAALCACGAVLTPRDHVDCSRCAPRAEQRRAAESRARVHKQRISEWWDRCSRTPDGLGVLPRWSWARWDHAEWRARCDPRVLTEVEAYTPTAGSRMIMAPTGAGKTSSVVAWLHAQRLVDRPPTWAYVTSHDLAEAARRRRLGADEHPLVGRAGRVGLLVLDELSRVAPADVVAGIAERRYGDGRPTLSLTGMTRTEMATHFGAATLRKLLEGGRLVDLLSPRTTKR